MALRRAMVHSIIQQFGVMLLSFATGVAVARLMTPGEVGPYAIAMAAVNVTAALRDFGIGSYVVSHAEDDEALLGAAYGLTLLTGVSIGLVLVILSWPLASFYNEPAVGVVLRIVALAQIIPAFAFTATMRLTRAMRFDALLVIGLVAASSQGLVAVGLAVLGLGAASLAWGYVAINTVTTILTLVYCRSAARVRPSLRGSRQLLAFGGWMSLALFIGSTAMSLPELMIGRMLGVADAALFSRGQNIVAIIRNGLFAALTRPMLPRFGANEREGLSLSPLYLRVIEVVTGLAWPAYALLVIWAKPLILLLYGPAWAAAGAMILPLAIAHGLTLAIAPHYDVLIVKRRARLLFTGELCVFLFTAAALALALQAGLTGAVWALALSSLFFAVIYLRLLRPLVGFRMREIAAVWLRGAVVTVAASLPALAIIRMTGNTPLETLTGFSLASMLAIPFWAIAAWMTRHELFTQAIGAIGSIRTKRKISKEAAVRHA